MALRYKFNPTSGQLDLVDIPATGSAIHIQKFVLSATDISNKYVVLSSSPTNFASTIVLMILEHKYGTDFEVTIDDDSKRLSWNGKGLESILLENDELTVIYN